MSAAPPCPKGMTHGPCGGVAVDGHCEVGPQPCSFLDSPTVAWAGPAPGPATASPLRGALAAGRVVVADFPAAALSAASIAAVGAVLHGRVDAVLAGDSPRNRVQFPPAYRARLITETGLACWAGLNCRDRNRVALEGELAALADLGVSAVHCVTGDHPASGSRPDAQPVFDLDSTELAALARAAGLLTSVAESPACPPVDRRPGRLAQKVAAGAEVVFIDHAGGVEPVRRFVERLPVHPWLIACVPVVVDRESAALLASFPGLVLPPGYLDLVLGASDPYAAGLEAAVELAEGLLEVPGVHGINLSGGGAPGAELGFAAALGEIADLLNPGGG